MNIFISYSSKNRPLVKTLVADLEALGHSAWFDQELTGGQKWWDNILTHLRESDVVLFALSPEWQASPACKLEYDYASALQKYLLPFRMTEGVLESLLPPELALLQMVDYRKPEARATVFALSRAFENSFAPRPLPVPLPLPPQPPINSLHKLVEQLNADIIWPPDQASLLLKLEDLFNQPDQRDEALALLQMFRKRPDLLVPMADKIDRLLGTVGKADNATASASALPQAVVGRIVEAISPTAPRIAPTDEGLQKGEAVIETRSAGYMNPINYEGKVTLTTRRLLFKGSYLTMQAAFDIPLGEIVRMSKEQQLFVTPVAVIHTRDGNVYKLALHALGGMAYGNREEFIAKIQAAIDAL